MLEFGFAKSRTDPVRPPAVAGSFYPEDPGELTLMLDRLLAEVELSPAGGRIVGLISPHAGYPYSGHVAARSFAALRQQQPARIVLIAPCHVEAFAGASVFDGRAYATPLGEVPVDRKFAEVLVRSGAARFSDAGHRRVGGGRGEHSLEVQLPFLQRVLDRFTLVPIVLGEREPETCRRLAVALAEILDEETVLVASSDLSHFHPAEEARELDGKVAAFVETWDYFSLLSCLDAGDCEACGGGPIVTTMLAAQLCGAGKSEVLRYANSGDVPPFRRDGVVGYLSALFRLDGEDGSGERERLSEQDRERLMEVARESVRRAVLREPPLELEEESPALSRPGAAFVTLRREGRLRGCIGAVVAREPLGRAVANAAAAAALRDPRFSPLSRDELAGLDCHISVLTPFRLLSRPKQFEIGRHGLLLERGFRRGLLLPQVAVEQSWDRETFLRQTCLKAGLEPDAWEDPETVVYTFTAELIGHE